MPLYLGTEDAGTDQFSLQDFEPSFKDKLNASVKEAWMESYFDVTKTKFKLSSAGEGQEKLPVDETKALIKDSGVAVKGIDPNAPYTKSQLDIILERQRQLTAAKDVRERTPWDMGSVVRGGAMFGAGILDPINLATAFVPWTKSISALRAIRAASVGAESFIARSGARAVLGAADGGISTAALEPFYGSARRDLGDDYSAMDSMSNIAFGTAFGGGLHVIGGAAGDAFKHFRGASEMVTPNPAADPIAPPAGAAMGADTEVKIGDTREPAQFAVVEADSLKATVDKADNQFRDRNRSAYQAEIQKRANELDPDLVLSTDNPLMDVGTPTVAADGRIIGGNGRTLFIDKAYEIGKGNDYRASLESRLQELGIDPATVQGMKKPVLVRRLQREVDVKKAAMLSNEGGSTDMSALEQSKVDAERLGDARLKVGADGDLQSPENRGAIRQWVEAQPENKRNALVDSDGKLSAEGLRRLNGALIYKAYGDSPTLGRLVESMDSGSRNIAQALGRTAPTIAVARDAIGSGDLHALDIAGDVQGAVEKYNALRDQGTKIPDYLNQMDAFGDGMTPESRLLLDFMDRNISAPRRIADAINGFYDRLTEAGNPKQGDLLGGSAVPDKTAMLEASIKAAESSVDTAAEVLARVSPETREAALRGAVAQSVEGRNVDVEAIVGMDDAVGTSTIEDVKAAADKSFEPESQQSADFAASAAVEARVKADAKKSWALDDANTAMADADTALADTLKAGDRAFQYSRAGDKPSTLKTDALWNAKDHDRNVDPSSTDLAALTEDVRTNGVKEPITLKVSEADGMAYVSDGNNRLAAARQAGIADVPYKVDKTDIPFTADELAKAKSLESLGVTAADLAPKQKSAAAIEAEAWLNAYSRDAASRGERMAEAPARVEFLTQKLNEAFGKSTQALLDSGKVKVVESVADLPGGPHPADVKAVTINRDQAYIVAENVSAKEARGLVLHEVGVHVGMETMLGRETFDAVLKQLDDAITSGAEWAQAARAAVPADTPAHLVREEQLAYLVQSSPELPLVKRIIAAIRAWVFKNFTSVQGVMKLTEADYQALAVSALHAVARGDADVHGGTGAMYARGETPDNSTVTEELKVHDERIVRAKQFASVLRAAADKLGNDAAATEAMRAAMPDISSAEIKDLLDQLRQSVKGLRGVARTTRDALGAEDVATGLQDEAMQAADELANNLELAAVIAKRNASLNLNARLKASSFVNQFRASGLDVEGFRGLLVGTERKRAGGRISVDAEQKNFRGEWIGGLLADVEKAGVREAFVSGQFDRDAYTALWNIGREGADNSKLAPEAIKIAEIINKYQSDARATRNRFGAWIRDAQGYIVRQSHDMYKIRDAGENGWIEHVLPRLDLVKMRKLGIVGDDIQASLRGMYDDFAAGSHMKPMAGEDDIAAMGRGSNLAKRESASRSLYFKDGNAAFEYNEKFGNGRLADAVLTGLDHSAKSAGLLKILGTNPEATLLRVFDEYADSLTGAKRNKFMSSRKEIENMLSVVDGSMNIPGNALGAKIGSTLRSLQSMAKLGGALISGMTDLVNYGAEMRMSQGKNLLSGTLDGMSALVQGRAKGEKAAILNSLGVFHESVLGSVFHRFDSPDLVGGKTAWAMQQFFKLGGLTWWTESLQDGAALRHSNYLASNARHAFDKLPADLHDMLGLYNIDAGKWDILRIASMTEADGRKYMTPEGLKTVPTAALENYIKQAGRTASDAAILNLHDDLSSALRTMTIDRMHHAVIEPNARTRAFMLRGTQPGTVAGEFLRYAGQFKSFPVAMIQMVLGREIYGRGYDSLGAYRRAGWNEVKGIVTGNYQGVQALGDMLGLATFIGLSTMMGYAAMSIKDLIKGKNPRPVDSARTWAAAMVQGGGLGIYGDFLFAKYNRMGGTLSGSLAGPVVNMADTAADLWTRIRTGDDFGATAFNAALQNTPFMNLFYTRAALDYLVIYRMQEAMNPGFLRRMEKRAERENGQTFYLPPSSVAR
jgi:hypothetical protein